MLGCCKCPTLLVLCRGSIPIMTCCGLMDRKASITTLPLTDCIGSMTTATALGLSCSKDWDTAVAIWGTSVSEFGDANPRMADLLSVDVDARQPAAEAGMRMVPTDHHLWSGY